MGIIIITDLLREGIDREKEVIRCKILSGM